MIYKKIIFITLVMLIAVVTGCNDPYNNKVDESDTDYVTNDNQHEPTELDNWLLNNFTYPYNIEVKYRWNASEGDLYKTLVPPATSNIQTVMDVVKKIWIDTYVDVAGETFIKTYCPKQFLLIGSARYNFDGSITMGTAEGGRKVVLYVVNEFDQTDREAVKRLMHIVEHEFGHILHQHISYPSEFKELTRGSYTATWNLISTASARNIGFITSYAMASADEDFVEMIATMLIEGKEGYEAILACETNETSKAILREKEKLVVRYFKETYNIDFYALQTKVQEALTVIAPPDDGGEGQQPLNDIFGYGKTYAAMRIDMSMLSEPADFVDRYTYDNRVLHNAGLALDYNLKVYFTSESEMAVRVYYYTIDDDTREFKQANFYYYVETNEDGTITLFPTWADENGLYLSDDLKANGIVGYFANRVFTIDWLNSCSGNSYAAFFPKDAPANYCFGILGN